MKRIFSVIAALAVWTSVAFAQFSSIPQRLELVEIEVNEGETILEIFNMPKDGENHYYLSLGHTGLGDEIIQINIDPVNELFIPLGSTLDEAQAFLDDLKALFKKDPGTSIEVDGCVAVGFPGDDIEPVTVTYYKRMLGRQLEFKVPRDGYIRATYVSKSELGSVISSLKFYRKLHKKEK